MPLDGRHWRRSFLTDRLAEVAAALLGLALADSKAKTSVTDTCLRIGQSALFSGVAQDFGIDYCAGILLAFVRTIKATGILGRKLQVTGTSKLADFPLGYGPKNHNGSNFVNLAMHGSDGHLVR